MVRLDWSYGENGSGSLPERCPTPVGTLLLEERQQVTVTISDATGIAPDHPLLVSPAEWAEAANDDIGLEEVGRALSTIHGSFSEATLEERRER